jgi:hypothetical protein
MLHSKIWATNANIKIQFYRKDTPSNLHFLELFLKRLLLQHIAFND